ncbi:hypothetical protein ACHHYP_08833 [Achlya hypogyna]|uniref:Uncharacterized protein n=1 Tax=Achlya hypogyna TaxID=1202772 RepID=A0A1V9YP13_ACHHY|nr:hypothetical protein ACHHYP_08833 [Achlya hypogyna]
MLKSWTGRERARDLAGLGYLALTTSLSVASLALIGPYMANDYFWPGFGSTATSRVLTAVLNGQLTLTASVPQLQLDSPAAALDAVDSGINPSYARLVFYRDLSTVESAIAGLRRLDVARVTYLMAAYCWADIGKKWSMTHTAQRQARCYDRYHANAAVHLEAILRNIDFGTWMALNNARFMTRIGTPIAATPSGPSG